MPTGETTEAFPRSRRLHDQAVEVFPSGVNSSLRALEQPVPLTFSHGRGSRIVDVDGNEYVDFQLGQGALILGHADPRLAAALTAQIERGTHFAGQSEIELSAGLRLVDAIPSVERVRFTNSATEAVLAALRLARAATGRERVLRFEGHYHGWSDEGLAGFAPPAQSWLEHGSPAAHPSRGVLPAAVEQFVVARFNDPEGLLELVDGCRDLAAIILEPVMCNSGCIAPEPAFLAALEEVHRASGCLLIADETITALRFGRAGAQTRYGIDADLTVVGKAIGAGLPVAAFGGREHLMDLVARGVVGHAGTFNGNPLCMAAVDHVLATLSDEAIAEAEARAERLARALRGVAADHGLPLVVQQHGTAVHTAFSDAAALREYRDVVALTDAERWNRTRSALLRDGVRVLERGLWYLSVAHDDEDVERGARALAAVAESEQRSAGG